MKLAYLSILLFILTSCKKEVEICLQYYDSYSLSGKTLFNGQEWRPEGVSVFTNDGKFGVNLTKCIDFPLANKIRVVNLELNDSLDFNNQTNSSGVPYVYVGHSDQSRHSCGMYLDTLIPGSVSFKKQNETQYRLVLTCDVRPDFNFVGWCDEMTQGEDTVRMDLDVIITRV